MPTGLIRLITTQKVLKTWSVKGMKQTYLGSNQGIIDTTCCGAFKRKSAKEANQLIEDLAKSNYRAPSETSGRNSRLKGDGIIELNKMSTIEPKLDALMSKMNN